ncbi:hypothetical protein T265_14779, partial [Opisthorchis viverrini]
METPDMWSDQSTTSSISVSPVERVRPFRRADSGELQRKLGLKVLNLGGNSVIGYQLHFDLEGETGVVVRGIGTAVRLRKQTAPRSPPSSPVGAPPRLPGSIELNTESPVGSADTPSALEREAPFKGSTGNLSQAMELG